MDLGDRMKGYEAVSAGQLLRRVPVIVRVDGRAFHSLKLEKPFDHVFISCMREAAELLAQEMQGFRLGYVASDEASFLLCDWDNVNTEPWFGYDLAKVISISAAAMTAEFNRTCDPHRDMSLFDSRAFNVPLHDLPNYFLWRYQDWQRNSLSMYARSFFSHKQLHQKGREDMHEMLHGIGKNWATDVAPIVRNGSFLVRRDDGEYTYPLKWEIPDAQMGYADIKDLVEAVLPKEESKCPTPS